MDIRAIAEQIHDTICLSGKSAKGAEIARLRDRYEELKGELSFEDAARQARVEFIMEVLHDMKQEE